jgi:hypothetical protein
MDPTERELRARSLRMAHMARMSLLASISRAARREVS